MSTNGMNWEDRYSIIKDSGSQDFVKTYMDEYKKVKQMVESDKDEIDFSDKKALDKELIALRRAIEVHAIRDDLVKKLYIATLLLPDDEEFQKVYSECGKNNALCAEKFNVPVDVVKNKVVAIKTFGVISVDNEIEEETIIPQALETQKIVLEDEEKSDETMFADEKITEKQDDVLEQTEISKESDSTQVGFDNVEKNTVASIAKINALFQENEAKTGVIERQVGTIDKLNEKISHLEEDVKEKEAIIRAKEQEILELSKKAATLEQEIKPLRDFYQRVMSSLDEGKKLR